MTEPWTPDLARRLAMLASAPHLLICTDYDGTLAPIAARPEDAEVLPGARLLLQELAGAPHTRVAVLSGRSLENLRVHSGFEPPIVLVGSHGAESSRRPSSRATDDERARLDQLHVVLDEMCADVAGAWLERKPLSVAVHVRQAGRTDAERVLSELRAGPARWSGIHATEGKEVLELAVSRANKGDALTALRREWGTDPRVLFMGDDRTDEAAFAVLGPGDVGVKVGEGDTRASHCVASEEVVVAILAFLHRQRTAATGQPPREARLSGVVSREGP